MFHYYDLECAETFVFDEFLINQIRSGVTVTPEHNKMLKEIIDNHFMNKPVVYISNRINSYSVDPLTYLATSKIFNILGMAVIAKKDMVKNNALFEGNFYGKPFEVFDTLSDAVAWAHKLILEQSD